MRNEVGSFSENAQIDSGGSKKIEVLSESQQKKINQLRSLMVQIKAPEIEVDSYKSWKEQYTEYQEKTSALRQELAIELESRIESLEIYLDGSEKNLEIFFGLIEELREIINGIYLKQMSDSKIVLSLRKKIGHLLLGNIEKIAQTKLSKSDLAALVGLMNELLNTEKFSVLTYKLNEIIIKNINTSLPTIEENYGLEEFDHYIIDEEERYQYHEDREFSHNFFVMLNKMVDLNGYYREQALKLVLELNPQNWEKKYTDLLVDRFTDKTRDNRDLEKKLGISREKYLFWRDKWQEAGQVILRESKNQEERKIDIIHENTQFLALLEQRKTGIAQELNERFGIINFARYPEGFLLEQYENMDKDDLPYVVVIYPYSDWSQSFYHSKIQFSELYVKIKGKYHLRFFECGGKTELIQKLFHCKNKYKNHKIASAVIGGHGTRESIIFGNSEDGLLRMTDFLNPSYPDTQLKVGKVEFFEPGATIILKSCSTGALGGIAQRMSELNSNLLFIGPKEDSYINSFGAMITKNPRGEEVLKFYPKYETYDKETKESRRVEKNVYLKGKKIYYRRNNRNKKIRQ